MYFYYIIQYLEIMHINILINICNIYNFDIFTKKTLDPGAQRTHAIKTIFFIPLKPCSRVGAIEEQVTSRLTMDDE